MDTQKNDEKNIVLQLKRQLGRMMVQVDYMYRNDREMSRLDLDIMMERTREIYNLLCDYQADSVEKDVVEKEIVNTEINEGGELKNRNVELEIETPEDILREPEPVEEEEAVEEDEHIQEEKIIEDDDVQPENEENTSDDVNEVIEEEIVEDKPEEISEETPEETKHVLEVSEDDEDEEDWEDEDDEIFHIEPESKEPEVMEPEDNSLAARLQRAHVSDIRMAIGINDKVMIVNDLFGGSVERYNKSVDALNDFPTLSGAKVYMSELQIELQWDTECQAYKMLNDLVERRFV